MPKQQNNPKKVVHFPENLPIGRKLRAWDRRELIKKTGYTNAHISAVFTGRRRMNEKIKRAIIELKQEQQQLNQALEQAIQEE